MESAIRAPPEEGKDMATVLQKNCIFKDIILKLKLRQSNALQRIILIINYKHKYNIFKLKGRVINYQLFLHEPRYNFSTFWLHTEFLCNTC